MVYISKRNIKSENIFSIFYFYAFCNTSKDMAKASLIDMQKELRSMEILHTYNNARTIRKCTYIILYCNRFFLHIFADKYILKTIFYHNALKTKEFDKTVYIGIKSAKHETRKKTFCFNI